MKSITIHGLDEPVFRLLKTRAHNEGESLNKTIKKLLEQSLGVKSAQMHPHRREFEDLCGAWGKEEKERFDKAVSDFEKIDKSEWK
jgi:plasmid stability protein